MINRMVRLTISLPEEYVAAAKRTAGRDKTNVSALAARALRNELLRRDMAALARDRAETDADVLEAMNEARGW